MHLLKKNGQNKFVTIIMALSFVFWPHFDLFFSSLGEPLNLLGFGFFFLVNLIIYLNGMNLLLLIIKNFWKFDPP